MAETNSLLNCRTGNCTASSNLAPTAIILDRSNLSSGRSVVRSSRLVWDQEVAGSNPAAPTRGMSNHPPFLIIDVVNPHFTTIGPVAQLDRATAF